MFGSHFLTFNERAFIASEYRRMLSGPDATLVAITYKYYIGSEAIDPVYHVDDREQGESNVYNARCIQAIVNEDFLRENPHAFLVLGDCVFWFDMSLDIDKPDGINEPIPNSLMIIDPKGFRWKPKVENFKDADALSMRVGEEQISQVIVAARYNV